jgi:hypothetical protein
MTRHVLGLYILLFLGSVSLHAQNQATIVGTVRDPSGAVVPNAKITVSNPDKGFIRHLVTNSAGAYTAAEIPIGIYTISAEAAGFQSVVRNGLSLSVGRVLRVDIQLRVGSQAQKITVQGNAAAVQTETGTISSVITGTQVTQLNLNGRNFTNLAILIPGAAPGYGYNPFSVGVLADAGISFNGMPTQYNNYEIDGVNNEDEGAGSTAVMVYPNIDAIAEFRISTSTYDAQYGKNSGATIEVATKSGTNKIHGSLFEFDRNNAFDANNWFLNRTISPTGASAPEVPLKWNDYGFTLGGPVYIPKVIDGRRSRTYVFWSEEWKAEEQGTIINAQVPTQRMRLGDFSECDPKSSVYNPVVASNCVLPKNPTTGTLFANDTVPISTDGTGLLNGLFPLPNNGVDTYTAAPSLPTNWREDLVRVDQNIGDKTSIFVHYIQDSYNQTFTPTLWVSAEYPTVATEWTSPSKSAAINIVRSIRPDLLNEFNAGFSADVNTVNQTTGFASPAGSINKPSDWNAPTLFPANASNPLLPGVSVCGGLPFCASEMTGYNYFFWGPILQLKDNVAWTKGNHMLRFGGYLQRIALNQTTDGGQMTQGAFTFSNSAPNSTGNALADMYMGRIASYTEYGRMINGQAVGGYALGHWREWDFEPYFQDDWHATRGLTLNIGVRYYLPTPFHDILSPNLDSIFFPNLYNPSAEAVLNSSGNLVPGTGHTYLQYGNGLLACGQGNINAGCLVPYRGSIAPRFGFAWDPTSSGKTVIRGGYGIFYDVSNGNEGSAGFFGNPPAVATPSVYYVNGYSNIRSSTAPLPPTSFENESYYQTWPSVQQFSFGVQHEFGNSNILSISYVGDLGRNLERARNLNQVLPGEGTKNIPALAGMPGCDAQGNCNVQNALINNLEPNIFFVPYPGYGTILNREWTGISNYNSLQMDFRHTVGHGLTFEASYTWSHTLDDTLGLNGTNGVNDYNLTRWYANSSLDQPQMLVLNYVYNLPFFAHTQNAAVRSILGGWELSGITSFLSGNPIDLSCGIAGLSSGVGGSVRCNSLGPLKIKKGTTNDPQFGPTPTWFDPSMIGQTDLSQLPANGEPGMFGYMGRNPLIGPGRNNWDLAILKNFETPWFTGEHSTLQFRLETFNTFNHPQWNGVNAFCGSETPPGTPCSGIVNNLGNGEVNSAWPAREIQLGMKFTF